MRPERTRRRRRAEAALRHPRTPGPRAPRRPRAGPAMRREMNGVTKSRFEVRPRPVLLWGERPGPARLRRPRVLCGDPPPAMRALGSVPAAGPDSAALGQILRALFEWGIGVVRGLGDLGGSGV